MNNFNTLRISSSDELLKPSCGEIEGVLGDEAQCLATRQLCDEGIVNKRNKRNKKGG
jgi:hypothetical protein